MGFAVDWIWVIPGECPVAFRSLVWVIGRWQYPSQGQEALGKEQFALSHKSWGCGGSPASGT